MSLSLIIFINFGCASRGEKPVIEDIFKTHIDEDHVKKFSYTITLEKKSSKSREKRKPGGKGRKGGKGGRGEGGAYSRNNENGNNDGDNDTKKIGRMQKVLNEGLNKKLLETNYCKSGHIVIDEDIRQGTATVNGNCIDKASNDDIKLFPNENDQPLIIQEEDLETIYYQ